MMMMMIVMMRMRVMGRMRMIHGTGEIRVVERRESWLDGGARGMVRLLDT